jgi:phenylacetate-CoA ligase
MGIGDSGISLGGECEEQDGMHLGARGFVHPELIDPETGEVVALEDGASGELVLTHLRHQAAPLLRFRTRDHVHVRMGTCACGRTGPRVRCVGRTDDMLIVRGVNVFPSAVRDVVSAFAPAVSGQILVRPRTAGVKQEPPLPVSVELVRDATGARGSGPPRSRPRTHDHPRQHPALQPRADVHRRGFQMQDQLQHREFRRDFGDR